MLVLTRKVDEEIYIGDDIVVTVVELKSDRVRIGITAPDEISVHRREIYEKIQRDKEMPGATMGQFLARRRSKTA